MKNPHFFVLVRSWNAWHYFDRCIDSIFRQKYSDYTVLFVDDYSPYTQQQKKYIKHKLTNHVAIFNTARKYSLRNAYELIHQYAKKQSVIVTVDGDDWLLGRQVFSYLARIYTQTTCAFTYGDCLFHKPGTPIHKKLASDCGRDNHEYPSWVKEKKSFRRYFFLPLHLRTWKTELFTSIPRSQFVDERGHWFRFCEDQAIYYPFLESGAPYQVIQKPLSIYNSGHTHSDEALHHKDMLLDEIRIRKKPHVTSLLFNHS